MTADSSPRHPSKERHKEEFLDYVDGDVFRGLGVDVEIGVRSVFEVMCQRMDPGEVEKVIRLLPKELQAPYGRPGGGQPRWLSQRDGPEISVPWGPASQ